jgi:hypothetical protein
MDTGTAAHLLDTFLAVYTLADRADMVAAVVAGNKAVAGLPCLLLPGNLDQAIWL